MAPRIGFGEHPHIGSHADGTEREVTIGKPMLHSWKQYRKQSATGHRCVPDLQE